MPPLLRDENDRLPVYCINLPDESERFQALAEQAAQWPFLDLRRQVAVAGAYLPDLAAVMLTRNQWSPAHKGVLGCFLSHVRVWERIAAGDGPVLVIEDDAVLANIETLKTLSLPAAVELVFCNERTAYPGDVGLRPVEPILAYVAEHRRAVGTDGYILTPHGARRLLTFVREDSVFTHVDLRMMAYSIDLPAADATEHLSDFNRTIAALRRTYRIENRVRALSLFPPLTLHGPGESRRNAQDRLGATR